MRKKVRTAHEIELARERNNAKARRFHAKNRETINATARLKYATSRIGKQDGRKVCRVSSTWYSRHAKEAKAASKAWRASHLERAKDRAAEWHAANREVNNARSRDWRETNLDRHNFIKKRWNEANPDRVKANAKASYLRNQSRKAAQNAARYLADPEGHRARSLAWHRANLDKPNYILKRRIRIRLAGLVRLGNATARESTLKLVGCSGSELRLHIESLFLPGMSWANRSDWHIDHIRPCNTFDLHDPAQQAACFHYTNLRPLWAAQNLRRPRDGRDLLAA